MKVIKTINTLEEEVIDHPTGLISVDDFTDIIRDVEMELPENAPPRNDKKLITLDHKDVLTNLLEELKPINFEMRVADTEAGKLAKKHFLILSCEEVLAKAKENYWSLCKSNGFIYAFNIAFWKQLSKEDLMHFLGEAAEKRGVEIFDARHYSFKLEMLKQFLSMSYLQRPERKGEEVLINLKNGTFVITPDSQTLKSFDSSDFLTYQLQFEYQGDAVAPIFKKYLDKVLPDSDQQKVLAEYIVSLFIKQRTLKLEKALVLFGNGANGKSVFSDTICALLGSENVCNYSLESLTNNTGNQRAKLGDKLLNYASEISPRMDSTLFKQLISGEPVEARLLYQDAILVEDYAKFIFNTNTLPKDVEHNEAFFRRFLLIHFNVTIPEADRDPQLASIIIKDELPGVFNWALEGLKRLLDNKKFTESEAIKLAVTEYRMNSDTVHLFLEDAGYTPCQLQEKPLKFLYQEYRTYCIESGNRPCEDRSFGKRMEQHSYVKVRKSSGWFVGIKKVLPMPPFPSPGVLVDLYGETNVANVLNVAI